MTTKRKPGGPKKIASKKRKSFCISFDPDVLKELDKKRKLISRSRFAEDAVITKLKSMK